MALAQLQEDARVSLQHAVEFSFDEQRDDGHWVAEVSADVTFTCEYVMFKYAIEGLGLNEDGDAIRRWLLREQNEDGSWSLGPKLPGNVSTTTEAYLALKILGVTPDEPVMLRARTFMIKSGGVATVRFFTRFFLATFGLFPWSAIPQLPAEFILMPTYSPLNIYKMSSWARSTLIPILIVRHHEPVYALPNGRNVDNDFLDEIWCCPDNKNVPFAPPLSDQFWERDFVGFGFTAIDKVIAKLDGLKKFPLRELSRKKCIDWLLEHQETTGDWAGFFPPMHGSIWALILEGFSLDDKAVRLGLEALERLAITDEHGKRIQSTISPLWDTALMLLSLCDAGVAKDPRVGKAIEWMKVRQLLVPTGDWRVYCPGTQAGGWSFQYSNTWYPDVDDTAVVVMALVKHDPHLIESDSISNAVQWILDMQNPDGGWAAFDYENDKLWLHKIPFSDMDSLCDPSTADVTGRILECFGLLCAHRKGSLDRKLLPQVKAASVRGIAFLLKEQEACGAWWGRWGSNYTYGTGNVLRGFTHFANYSPELQRAIGHAIQWFESIQNSDGGWGEDLKSYQFPELAGQGVSTAAQTAWALQSLLPYRPPSDPAIEKGIRWLIANQTIKSGHGASWPTDVYTGTGFPKVLYLGYPYYHHFFPIMALARYANSSVETSFKAVELLPHDVERLNRPSILFMVIGSRGDITAFLSIAKLLTTTFGYRVRIATHPSHQALVEGQGIEFFSVGGNPDAFAKTLTEKPNTLYSAITGEFGALRRSFNLMLAKYWRSSIDSTPNTDSAGKLQERPFLADTIVSGTSTLPHVHCAEKLQVPLVLVSVQPLLPTSNFPHVLTMTKPELSPGHPWNYLSYFCLELVNWLAFGPYLNHLRVKEYGMKPVSWIWATYDVVKMKIPHVCLWSPRILPRPSEWGPSVTIAGYTYFDDEKSYRPPKTLEKFFDTDKPVIAIGFGSAGIPNPVKSVNAIFDAVEKVGAKAVVCRGWSKTTLDILVPDHIFLVDEIPHKWLLPRVNGFVHHGGAGHAAAGLKYGTPMLIVPVFLDQHFWAAKVRQLKLGPQALRSRDLTVPKLVVSLEDMLNPMYQQQCAAMASKMSSDKDGADVAAETIARIQTAAERNPSCCVIPALKAHWEHVDSGLRLSSTAAACLASHDILHWSDLELVPGLNWSDQKSGTSAGMLKALNRLVNLIYRLVLIFSTALSWVVGPWGTVNTDDNHSINRQDPVRQARMQQGEYDLQTIQRHAPDTASDGRIEDQIIRAWQTLSASEFRDRFNRGLVKE